MGRKPAPQPLALAESALLASDRSPAETSLQVDSSANSFIQSRSPRSPSSPLRYADKNSQSHTLTTSPLSLASGSASAREPPRHLADLVSQSLVIDDYETASQYLPSDSSQQQLSSQALSSQPDLRLKQSQQQPQQPSQQSLQQQQQQPQQVQKQKKHLGHGRYRQNDEKASKSNFFFHFGKSSRSTDRLVSESQDPRDGLVSRGGDLSTGKNVKSLDPSSYADHHTLDRSNSDQPSQSSASLASLSTDAEAASSTSKKGKPKTFGRLGRSRSNRDNEKNDSINTSNGTSTSTGTSNGNTNGNNTNSSNNSNSGQSGQSGSKPNPLKSNVPNNPGLVQETVSMRVIEQPERAYQPAVTLKTAAAAAPYDSSHRDMMSSGSRNVSADRSRARDVPSHRNGHPDEHRDGGHRDGHRNGHRDRDRQLAPNARENGSYTFFNGLKNSSSRAADMISKGLFGKSGRSASTTERELVVDDEHYVLKVINKPLVEQVRLTRISKRLEDSRDKTEFWMPAFPWRAIDYLNFKGTDVEGLYRVPGSGPQIKKWQRKFDEEHDVDLLAQDDLYDINIVGSMLKAWLRELPDELFPKEAQERIARECAGSEEVPQMLIDELSNLSPFNYYLLFAITCHLSLLLAHSDKNKMDFRNLCICFQPCMKIDAFSFKFLVCDWRECWKGCRNEIHYIEEEYRLFDLPPPTGISTPQPGSYNPTIMADDMGATADSVGTTATLTNRHILSSDGNENMQSSETVYGFKGQAKKKSPTLETGSVSTISTTLTMESQRVVTPPGQSGDLRPLSPIKPLSPLGF